MKTIPLGLVGTAALASFALAQSSNPLPVNWKELPPPFQTPSVRNNSEVISRPEGARLQLPQGFVVDEYLSGFKRPRYMLLGPANEILLADSGSREPDGVVYVIENENRAPIIEKLDRPYGLALAGDRLFVAETTSVKEYPYDRKTRRVTGPGKEIIPLQEFGAGHWTRTVLIDPEGKKLYLTVGSRSNIDLGEPAMRAAVHRFNLDGTGHETVATGLRNPVGLRWYPGTEDLWVSVQERDGLGDDLVPDYLARLKPGGFYGWPIAYIGPHAEPRHENPDMAKVQSTLYPDVLLGAHVAALDMVFYTGRQFPERYRGGLFVAFHGSWNRAERTGYKIAFVPFKDGRPLAGPEDFLTGFMLDPKKREVWGRPVGLLQLPDGSLLLSDDGGGRIWRVRYTGQATSSAGH